MIEKRFEIKPNVYFRRKYSKDDLNCLVWIVLRVYYLFCFYMSIAETNLPLYV